MTVLTAETSAANYRLTRRHVSEEWEKIRLFKIRNNFF